MRRHHLCDPAVPGRGVGASGFPGVSEAADPSAELGLLEDVYNALQGWTDDTLSCLSRTSVTPEVRHDGVKVYRLEFSTAFEEEA